MKLPIYQVDAFAESAFTGNPAAVVPLESWLDEVLMQSISAENNLSETAFFVKEGPSFRIRWFTPTTEVSLCGHATLAAAWVIFNELGFDDDSISFKSASGELQVTQKGTALQLNFPAQTIEEQSISPEVISALNIQPKQLFKSEDLIAVLESSEAVGNCAPDFWALEQLPYRGVIVTAVASTGYGCDFVARFFAPQSGIKEDPVTGSAYTILAPYWSQRLGKNKLVAKQLSKRGGTVWCELFGDRVLISGKVKKYMVGEIYL